MDRVIVYPNALPRALDILRTNQYGMVGLANLSQATLGTSTVVDGFTLTPTNPTSLTCNLGPGQIYQVANLENTAISSLPGDGTQIVKQGALLSTTQQTFAPQLSVGQSACYLVQMAYADADTGDTTLNFYNAANPSIPLSGVDGNGAKSKTIRSGTVSVSIKAGTPTTGIPTAPAPDAGYVGVFVVTLSYGQVQILAGNIATYAGAPFVPDKLPRIPSGVQSNRYTYVKDSGAVNAMIVTPYPAITAPGEGTELLILPSFSNTAINPTLTVSGNTAIVLKRDGSPMSPGDIKAGVRFRVIFDGQYWRLQGMALSDIPVQSGGAQPTPISIVQSAGSPFNFKNVSTSTRTNASAASAGLQVTVASGLSYTKRSATSNLVIVANFSSYSPVIPGQGNGADTVRITTSAGVLQSVGLNNAFNTANGAPGGSGSNSPTFVLPGIPAGALTFSLSYSRGDAYSWNTIFNPYPSDYGTTGPNPNAFFFIYEYEPSA